jgi:phage major head subunit gpT-like protein
MDDRTSNEPLDSSPEGSRLKESIDLIEAEVADADKHIVEVTLIRAGTSRNGNRYPPEVLRESVPLFEGIRAFADHQRPDDLPERSIRDLVGHYRNVHLDESGRLRGELHLVPGNDWLFHLLSEAQAYPDLCGISIDADGDVDRRTPPRTVRKLLRVSSADIVTRPAAGGSVDRLIQAERGATSSVGPRNIAPAPGSDTSPLQKEHQSMNDTNEQRAATQDAATSDETQASVSTDLASLVEAQNRELEAARAELARVQAILNPASSDKPSDPTAGVSALVEEIKRERDAERAQRIVTAKIAEADLPEPVARKLHKRFDGQTFSSTLVESLDTAIAEEKETLAALTSAGQVTGMGFEKTVTTGMSEYDQLQAAFDGLFDIHESEAARSVPKLSGIREAFAIATGTDIGSTGGADRPIREAFAAGLRAKVRAGNLTESEILLREADVTNATFSYLLGTSMNKRLLKDYQGWPSEWQKIANVVAIKDFKQQDRVRLGAFGSLSTVSEDAAYTTLTLADTRASYTPTKRGNLVQVTRETIINDDLYAIKQIPQKLAVAAAFTLAEFVYNLLAPNFGNIYDSHPLFDSVNHGNTGVVAANLGTANSGAALTSAALQAAVVKMRKQTNMASKPLGLKPRYLLVPPDLEFTAMTILKSAGLPGGNNNDINPMMGYAEPIVAPQLNNLTAGPASTSIWIAVADPRVIDTLEVGFVGGQANPVLLIQDMPLYGLNFTQDVISYKVRHEYGGAVVDYRGFYLGNN